MRFNIPEGYELFTVRSQETARRAIEKAAERGYPESTVLTVEDGYLVPLGVDAVETTPGPEDGEPVVIDGQPVSDGVEMRPAVVTFDPSARVAEIDAFIDANDLDVDKLLNKSDKIDAVKAALETKGE